jgi:hypothetical protein
VNPNPIETVVREEILALVPVITSRAGYLLDEGYVSDPTINTCHLSIKLI